MKKLNILFILMLFSCSYPNRDTEVENQIADQIAQSGYEDKNEITLNFNHLKPKDTWDSLILYSPYSKVDPDYNFRVGLYTTVEDIKQADFYVTVGFLQDRKLTSYALIDRNPDLLQIFPANKTLIIFAREDAVFNLKYNKAQ